MREATAPVALRARSPYIFRGVMGKLGLSRSVTRLRAHASVSVCCYVPGSAKVCHSVSYLLLGRRHPNLEIPQRVEDDSCFSHRRH